MYPNYLSPSWSGNWFTRVRHHWSPQKSQFFSRGLGLHDLHAGFNCLAWMKISSFHSACFAPFSTKEKKPLEILPFLDRRRHTKNTCSMHILKENIKNGNHIDLGEGHQHFTKISGRDSLLATEQYDTGGFCVFLFGHCFLAFRKKIMGISLRPKGLTKKNSSKRNVFF